MPWDPTELVTRIQDKSYNCRSAKSGPLFDRPRIVAKWSNWAEKGDKKVMIKGLMGFGEIIEE